MWPEFHSQTLQKIWETKKLVKMKTINKYNQSERLL